MQASKLKLGLLGVLAMSTIAPMAQAEESAWGPVTGGVTLTSDYRFRGISQTDRDAAAQGWLQYDHASGFFANVWTSTIDFNDEAEADSSIEVDLTAGYNFKIGSATDGSVKVVYYWYADADNPDPEYDYWEFIAGVGHDFGKFSMSGELAYSPEYFGESGDAWALTGGASVPVLDSFLFFTGGLEASAHLGHQWLDEDTDYLFYDFGASATWESITVDLRWVDTDLDADECVAFAGGDELCEGGVVLSVSAALPG